jgi:transposase-like protein
VDETYVKVKEKWSYLYRAVNSTCQTIDFMLSARRDARAAKRFFRKILKTRSHSSPRVINVDKNPAYPPAVEQSKEEGIIPIRTQLRQLNISTASSNRTIGSSKGASMPV